METAGTHSQNYDAGLMERLLFRVAKKWVAGYGTEKAIAAALDSNGRGMSAILNFLFWSLWLITILTVDRTG